MEKEVIKQMAAELIRMKMLRKMCEFTFMESGKKMHPWDMDKLLDMKLELDRRIKRLEQIIAELS